MLHRGCAGLRAAYPLCLRRIRDGCWWWSHDQFGEAAQVLRDGCERELVLGTTRTTKPKATKLQDGLEMSEQHLDAVTITARLCERIGVGE